MNDHSSIYILSKNKKKITTSIVEGSENAGATRTCSQ